MNFMEAVKTCFGKYATFDGRARRSEFWWFALFTVLASIVASMLGDIISSVVSLALLVPSVAVGARRLHDIGKSGWLQLLWIIPLIGWAILIYWAVQPGDANSNEHGNPPVGISDVALTPGQQ